MSNSTYNKLFGSFVKKKKKKKAGKTNGKFIKMGSDIMLK